MPSCSKLTVPFPRELLCLGTCSEVVTPTPDDRILSSQLGVWAVQALGEGHTGVMAGCVGGKRQLTKFEDTYASHKPIPVELLELLKTLANWLRTAVFPSGPRAVTTADCSVTARIQGSSNFFSVAGNQARGNSLFYLFFVFYCQLLLDSARPFTDNPDRVGISGPVFTGRIGYVRGELAQMRLRISIVTIFGIFALVASVVSAGDIYVDNQVGDDLYNGGSADLVGESAGPFRTIDRALRSAEKADRIIIANTGKPYRESITLQGGRNSGLPGAQFELIGNGAVLDGSATVPATAWSHYQGNVFRFEPPRTELPAIVPWMENPRLVEHARNRRNHRPQPTEWCHFDRCIYFCVDADRLPQSYALAYARLPVGITLYEVKMVVVRDLVIQGFQLDGVNAHDGVFGRNLVGTQLSRQRTQRHFDWRCITCEGRVLPGGE